MEAITTTRSQVVQQGGGSPTERTPASTRANRDLLPPPAPAGASAVAVDELGALFALMAEQRDAGVANEKTQIQGDKTKRDAEMRKMFEARKKEAAAKSGLGLGASLGKLLGDVVKNVVTIKPGRVFTGTAQNLHDMGNSPAFWKDLSAGAALVAKVASAVIAAATIITGPGAVGGVAFAAACISLVCMAEGEVDVMGRLGVSDGAAGNIRLGATALTFAMGNGQALSSVASTVGKGAQAGSTAVGGAVKTATTAQRVATAGTQTAKVLEPTAKSVQAGAGVAEAKPLHNAENHRADGEEHGFAKDSANRDLERRIQTSIEGMENQEKLLALVQNTLAARSQTTLSLAGAIGGRA